MNGIELRQRLYLEVLANSSDEHAALDVVENLAKAFEERYPKEPAQEDFMDGIGSISLEEEDQSDVCVRRYMNQSELFWKRMVGSPPSIRWVDERKHILQYTHTHTHTHTKHTNTH